MSNLNPQQFGDFTVDKVAHSYEVGGVYPINLQTLRSDRAEAQRSFSKSVPINRKGIPTVVNNMNKDRKN